jgi:16S rRNA C967 or C1407 C5-methylase (RsmB/RsmF family)/NOL1/NOP2/fmu family ribosome biogenesis protein
VHLPEKLLEDLEGLSGFDRDAFLEVHQSGKQITTIRINPSKNPQATPAFAKATAGKPNSELPTPNSELRTPNSELPIPWSQYGYYLDKRPSFTFDPLFHAGCYYVQEASSMFLEQAVRQSVDLSKPLKVLDCCAAPGGKSTHLQSLLSPQSLLISNETIRTRVPVLTDNIIKWGCDNVIVTNNDPSHFNRLEGFFDMIVVDAPCSGSGLIRRDPDALEEWSENNVQLCSERQQRILSATWPALKPGGVLIYSTCSYSREENEDITQWLLSGFPAEYLPLEIDPSWNITDTGRGYRFWPYKLKGEGFYLSVFRKTEGTENAIRTRKNNQLATEKEVQVIRSWIEDGDHKIINLENRFYAFAPAIAEIFTYVKEKLNLRYAGVLLGEIFKNKLVPDHSLALSTIIRPSIPAVEVELEQAINYLQRKNIEIDNKVPGWQLVRYKGHPLGWVNVLPGRINNYYPKELRILKENPGP